MTNLLFLYMIIICKLYTITATENAVPPPCDSDIFCYGKMLDTIEKAYVYPDSKTFVDMNLIDSKAQVLKQFRLLMRKTKGNVTKEDLEDFLDIWFRPPGSEYQHFEPLDWKPSPSFVDKIENEEFRKWARVLNAIWKDLARKISKDVKISPPRYSTIYVPNPVIVPGGRFREFYYWDSYWIVKGLLHSEMYSTVKGILENFLHMVRRYGLVPNGGRVYYTKRSQPPLLIPMVKMYLDATNDHKFLEFHMESLEKEFSHWLKQNTVEITKDDKNYTLARYKAESTGPRPESYREDSENAEVFETDEEKQVFFSEIKAAAESGWDFSSRWFISDGTNEGNISHVKTTSIIPVDLNAIIYWNAKLLSKFSNKLSNKEKEKKYLEISKEWLKAVTEVLWDEEEGIWLDYDNENKKSRNYFYVSNLSPLWTKCYDEKWKKEIVEKVLNYINKTGLMKYPGGIPTSLEQTGEQWDYPNVWPPLQHYVIMGLDSTGIKDAQKLAREIATNWINANYKGYQEAHVMYEKYDANVVGGYGGGGEYDVQSGFGWTNGVAIDLLVKYHSKKRSGDKGTANFGNKSISYGAISHLIILIFVLYASILALSSRSI